MEELCARYAFNVRAFQPYFVAQLAEDSAMLAEVLAAEGVVSQDEYLTISQGNDDSPTLMLDILSNKPSIEWVPCFMQTLDSMGQRNLVRIIEGIEEKMIFDKAVRKSTSQPETEGDASSDSEEVLNTSVSNATAEITSSETIESITYDLEDGEINLFDETNEDYSSGSEGSFNISSSSDRSMEGELTSSSPDVLALRSYQEELCVPALAGNNCVVVAPTGSGKTFVAVRICLEHLQKNPDGKVVFFVPKQPLVQQQFKVFKRFMPCDITVHPLSGADTVTTPPTEFIKKTRCLIMIHQILLTALEDKEVDISDFTLLIFDECHNARKNHPYNDIMRKYRERKRRSPNSRLPQVVGLTASVGCGRASSMEGAVGKVATFLANLDVRMAPVQVKQNKQELERFTCKELFETVAIRRNPNEKFSNRIIAIMRKIEKHVEEKMQQNENLVEGIGFPPGKQGTQVYEQHIVEFHEKCVLIDDDKLSQTLQVFAMQLRAYNDALVLNEHVREVDTVEFLKEKLFSDPSSLFHINLKLRELYEKSELCAMASRIPNPLLQNFIDILEQHFDTSPDSRCIVFVRTRDIARLLVKCLEERDSRFKLRPVYLTGAAVSNSQGGLTKPMQENRLDHFKAGESKVLVATSIADEGIDIKSCNLVVIYNHSSNEITHIQRKGRARALDSKMYILAYEDRNFIRKERMNSMRAQLTTDTLEMLSEMDKDQLSTMVEDAWNGLDGERAAPDKPRCDEEVWRFVCKHCGREATSSQHFRRVKQHFATIDRSFLSKMRLMPSAPVQLSVDEIVCRTMVCGNVECSAKWGAQMVYKQKDIYVLGIKNFVLINENNERIAPKKWKDAPFIVEKDFLDDCESAEDDTSDSEEDYD